MQECELYQYYIFLVIALLLVSLFFNLRYKQTIQKRQENENILIKNAYYHPVTSLPNKENIKIVISEQIDRALRHDKSFLIMLVKIKNYHEVKLHAKVLAEEFILEASNRLLQSTRDEDIIGHMSDDTFVVVFNEYLEERNYNIVLKRVEESFAESPELDTKYNIDFKISIGTCKYPEEANDVDSLIEKARNEAIDID
ncbi:GGDEF domain-containing protein [Sulfurimonas autotrophica]|uniref:Diguanylate cyclase n=1 Tax=Sulfurimonas autotrophica (strain ATCC BAA-671 / DSM 16294 / JCM 11897 / OK10) TaxID=563040 RepID=E0UQI2_SULAO|nr:diguanylate cyclase [Sulfurimonas autotrophica]ADN08784.1 diguanylate cyclase [Sulfurimonas autotrophica DSM 16294]